MLMLIGLLELLRRRSLPAAPRRSFNQTASSWRSWLPPLLPLLLISVLATAIQALMQSALPLDLVRGGLRRQPLPESLGALLIGLQLGLLLLLQWPLGKRLAQRPVATGLAISLSCFVIGCLLLAASALTSQGLVLLLAAQLPLAVGEAAFLPVATEAVVELTPSDQRGLAMALFSQCFAVSAVLAPLLAGALMQRQGHAVSVWLLMALACLAGLGLVAQLAGQQRRRLLQVLVGREQDGGSGVLFRFNQPSVPVRNGRAADSDGQDLPDSATRAAGGRDTGS